MLVPPVTKALACGAIALDKSHCLRFLRPDAPLQLLVLPYAGGSPNEFRSLQEQLPAEIGLALGIFPGRDRRIREVALRRMEPLVADLEAGLGPLLRRRYAILGHSMGSWVGYALCQGLQKAGLPLPEQLIVNARRAPGCPDPFPPLHPLPEREFLSVMQHRYGAIPPVLLEDPGLLALFLPALRADMELIETYEVAPAAPLPLPITAFGGRQDLTVTEAELAAWKASTSRSFHLRMIEGGHFFHKVPAFPDLLAQSLLEDD